MTAEHITALKQLWREAFGDPMSVIDAFFAVGFSPSRCNMLLEDDQPVSALYWFDCQLDGHRLAYLYAVATAKSHRNRGLAHRLMEDTHRLLADQGYAGVILVPGTPELFALYRSLGYRTATAVTECVTAWGDAPVRLTEVDAVTYSQLRKGFLPAGSVLQEEETLAYLQTQSQFYAGNDFLLAASAEGNTLCAQEFLGNPNAIPGILRTLQLPTGRFRMPGPGRDFAMFLPLQNNCPVPSYFGLALD